MSPLLASRQRVQAALPVDVAKVEAGGVLDELLLASGHRYRERDAGRIDLRLPWRHPFNATSLATNPLLLSALRPLLGDDFELKSAHVLYALPGAPDQTWHRDAPLLLLRSRCTVSVVRVGLGSCLVGPI